MIVFSYLIVITLLISIVGSFILIEKIKEAEREERRAQFWKAYIEAISSMPVTYETGYTILVEEDLNNGE